MLKPKAVFIKSNICMESANPVNIIIAVITHRIESPITLTGLG